jgi:apolipoprotein N-acyltransferase
LTAALGGLVFALCAPPTDAYPLVFVGLGLLYLTIRDAERGRSVFFRAWLWSACASLLGLRFVVGVVDRFTPLGVAGGAGALVLLAMGQAVPWGLGALLFRFLARRVRLPAPVAFAAGVTVASSVTLVIAWSPGALLSPWPVLIQLAEFVGERGVTFLVALTAALFAEPARRTFGGPKISPRRPLLFAGITLGVMLGFGVARMAAEDKGHASRPSMRVGVVQPVVEARLRWDPKARDEILSRLLALTRQSEAEGAELTLWHEAAYPHRIAASAHRMHRGRRAIVGRGVRGPVLFGALAEAPGAEGRFNAATIVDTEGRTQPVQAKMELLWFGETVPLSGAFPFLRRWFFRAGGLVPGQEVQLLHAGHAKIGVLNCFEDTLPNVGRRIARAEPNLLVNVTNDAWFGATAEPELHLRLSVLRAVEARRDLVRVVNLGMPAWIDSTGRVRARGSPDASGVLLVTPGLNDGAQTLYTKAGDSPLLFGLFLAGAIAFARRRADRPS